MRKKDQEITEKAVMESVIRDALVCRLAMVDGDRPYVVPLCFGYQGDTLYVHGAVKGKKIDLLKKNPNVCVEFDQNTGVVPAENPCDWDMKYRSVIGYGTATFVEDPYEKMAALSIIISHYSEKSFHLPEAQLRKTVVIRIDIEHMTGKQSGC